MKNRKRPTLNERNAFLANCWRAIYDARAATWTLTESLQGGGHMPERRRFEQLMHEVELLAVEVKTATGVQRRNKQPKLAMVPLRKHVQNLDK